MYMSMFRRPLSIVSYEGSPPVVKFKLSSEVKQEFARFVGLIPLRAAVATTIQGDLIEPLEIIEVLAIGLLMELVPFASRQTP